MSRMAVGVARPLTLEEAAGIAGVSAGYLRRLARENAVVAAAEDSAAVAEIARDVDTFGGPPDHDTLRANQDATGCWLVAPEELARFIRDREPPTVVIGYDLTFSAPKSLSLLWAFGDDDLRADIAASFEAGVNATLAYLERYAMVGTVGGRNRPGLGLAVAAYRHDISRAEDAHLHEHDIIANGVPVPVLDESGLPVLDANGVARVEWRALDGEVLTNRPREDRRVHRRGRTAARLQPPPRPCAGARSATASRNSPPSRRRCWMPSPHAAARWRRGLPNSSRTGSPPTPGRGWPPSAAPGQPNGCSPTPKCSRSNAVASPRRDGRPRRSAAWLREVTSHRARRRSPPCSNGWPVLVA